MSDKNELILAIFVAVVTLVVGIISYAAYSPPKHETPVRIIYETPGKNVLFDHYTHAQLLECTDCHHKIAGAKPDEIRSCTECHTKETKFVPAISQNGGKGLFNHEDHSDAYGLECTDCHHTYTEDDPAGPQPCSACHTPGEGEEGFPSLVDAYHQQCIGCHADMGSGPQKADCSACHHPRKSGKAFHDQCIGCHEDMGQGPGGGSDDCIICHGY